MTRTSLAVLACTAAFFLLSGCASKPPEPLDIALIGKTVAQIKEQVGIYQAIVNRDPSRTRPLPPIGQDHVCGPGLADFDITAVKAELTTKIETKKDGSGAVTAPIAPLPGATVGGGGGGGLDATNSQVLTFNMFPILNQKFTTLVNDEELRLPENSVSATLLAFRGALRQASFYKPCFSTVHDQAKDKPDTLVVGVEAVQDKSFNVTLKLIFLNLGGTDDQKQTNGSKVTFSFEPWPLVKISAPMKAASGKNKKTVGVGLRGGAVHRRDEIERRTTRPINIPDGSDTTAPQPPLPTKPPSEEGPQI